jgi:hypothetical protein
MGVAWRDRMSRVLEWGRVRLLELAHRRAALVMAAALLVWAIAYAGTMHRVFWGHSVTTPYRTYLAAARHLLAHRPLYQLRNIDGFQYPPQAAIAFVPIARLGSPYGEIAWRALGWALLASGVWRTCRTLAPGDRHACFLVATVLAVGTSTASLGNGQYNLCIAALVLHAVADLSARRWSMASAWLAVGLGLKQLMLVPAALVWALYRPMRWRIPIALLVVVLLPLVVVDRGYLLAQYEGCWAKTVISGRPDRLFDDVRGLLAPIWIMPHAVYGVVRLIMGTLALAICAIAHRRIREPFAIALIAGLAATYLMLFNPRNQPNSYVLVASLAGTLGAAWFVQGRVRLAAAVGLICGAWSINVHIAGDVLEFWWRPLWAVAFGALLVREAIGRGARPGVAAEPRASIDRVAGDPTG